MPEGWAWCRLKEVCTVFGRIGFRGYTRDDLVEKGNGAITLSPSNLINMKLDLTDCTYISWPKYEESPEIQLDINDVVVVKTGSSYGKTSFVDNLTEKTTLNPQLMVLKERKCNSKYLCYFLNTQYMRKHFEDLVNGTAIPTFSQEKFGMKIFPLPPASEQEKIVSRIELIFDKIDLLENDKENLDTIIKQTKSKILDLAIHGKLVPQDPIDEPAEELLKRIATSDNRPYKKFEEDEVPFIIPFNWKWERLAKISSIISKGTTPRGGKNAYCIEGINYLRVENISADGTINLEDINHISENEHLTFLKRSILQENDVIISIAGTLGKIGIIRKCDLPMNTNQAIAFVRISNLSIINLKYLRYVLESVELQRLLLSQTKVTSIPNLTLEIINNCPIPLPPIQEQNRIVSKIEELFSDLDSISSNLE